jgi:hypothetical protein
MDRDNFTSIIIIIIIIITSRSLLRFQVSSGILDPSDIWCTGLINRKLWTSTAQNNWKKRTDFVQALNEIQTCNPSPYTAPKRMHLRPCNHTDRKFEILCNAFSDTRVSFLILTTQRSQTPAVPNSCYSVTTRRHGLCTHTHKPRLYQSQVFNEHHAVVAFGGFTSRRRERIFVFGGLWVGKGSSCKSVNLNRHI